MTGATAWPRIRRADLILLGSLYWVETEGDCLLNFEGMGFELELVAALELESDFEITVTGDIGVGDTVAMLATAAMAAGAGQDSVMDSLFSLQDTLPISIWEFPNL